MAYRNSMEIVSDTNNLEKACKLLAQHPHCTVDTEFLRESTFWPELCLIQMAGPDHAFIVDVLADGISLDPFFELMADRDTLKVFHAARQDIEIVHHLCGEIPNPVFDTQVAAMVCGYGDSIYYDQLVNRITGVRLDKSHRFTDWSKRPLSNQQLEYALADVTHLNDVFAEIEAKLEQMDRHHWVAEEMDILTSPSTYDVPPENAWYRLKLRAKKPRELLITQKVAEWREITARHNNVPRGRVIKDDAIYDIATRAPSNIKQLIGLRSLSRGFDKARYGDSLLECIAMAKAIPEEDLPRMPRQRRMPEGNSAATEMLKVLLKIIAEEHGVAAKIIATVDDLDKIAGDDKADVAALKGWRKKLFGDKALELKSGHLGLVYRDRRIQVVEL
ncbi:MAG: ribonuclease D [Pseudomonadota bacterium]